MKLYRWKSLVLALERSEITFRSREDHHHLVRWLGVLWEEEVGGDTFVAVCGGITHLFHAPLGRGIVRRLQPPRSSPMVERVQQAAPRLEDRLADRLGVPWIARWKADAGSSARLRDLPADPL